MAFTVGQRVRCVRDHGTTYLTVGQEYEVTATDRWSDFVRVRLANGSERQFSGARFEAITLPVPEVGKHYRVINNGRDTTRHHFPVGTEVVCDTPPTAHGAGFYHTASGQPVGDREVISQYVDASSLEPVETPTTDPLLARRQEIMVKGAAAGERYGLQTQVTEALDDLARVEFWDPSPDVASFDARVIKFVMKHKEANRWCESAEDFLRDDLGLSLPRKRSVTVRVDLEVEVPSDASREDIRTAARSMITLPEDATFGTVRIND